MEELQLRIYNTMSREKEIFQPLMDEGKAEDVLIYTCGPTVYGEQHVGNMRAAYFADILKRTIKYICGYPVKHTTNITDVGHLTDDGDAGEDKMEKGSRKEGMTARDVARKYEKIYLEDVKSMGIELADHYPRATDYIKEQIKIVNQMFQKGLTYVIPDDGIYCDTSKIEDYGKLLPPGHLEGLQEGSRVDSSGKKNPTDFALWKFSPKGEQRQMEWIFAGDRMGQLVSDEIRESLSDKEKQTLGFPGWHVECSAMSWATLGKNIDIHTGGIDHIPVHHTNEIVQSEYSFCKNHPRVKYWMHLQFLNINAEKISKSIGNVVCISDVREKGIDPLAVRWFFHQAHYRSFQDFTREALEAAERSRMNLAKKLQSFGLSDEKKKEVMKIKSVYDFMNGGNTQQFVFGILQSLFDDLQMPQVLASVCASVKSLDEYTISFLYWFDQKILGLGLFDVVVEDNKVSLESLPQEVLGLAKERSEARKNKDWGKADELREKIASHGYGIEDKSSDFELVKL